jgi:prepilin-type N-terminal cleavage/methylation domain-containing protein
MIPLCRAAASAKADCRAAFRPVEHPGRRGASTKADVRGHSLTSDLCPLNSGFTLIEMTVVILIIATLAALVTTAGSNMFDRARKVQAKNDVTQIVTAVNAFYTEYGRYPVTLTSTTTDAFFGTGAVPAGCTSYGNNDVLVDVLRSNTTGANAANVTLLNPRAIVFLSPPAARNTTPPRGGISQTAGTGYGVGDYMDPWGSQYAIQIDTNYDSQMTNPYSDADGSAGTVPLRLGAIAFSYGKNGARGGGAKASSTFADESGAAGAFKSSGDVLSWQ